MKRLLLFSAFSLASIVSVRADVFYGNFTESLDTDHFTGYYSYISDTADGTFYTNGIEASYFPASYNYTLVGEIYVQFPPTGTIQGGFSDSLFGTIHYGDITISGDTVTDFFWNFESGPIYAQYADDYWYSLDFEPFATYSDGGSMSFSNPVDITLHPLPEGSSTAWLIGSAMFACLGIGKIKARVPVFGRPKLAST